MEQKKQRINGFDIAVVAVIVLGIFAWFFLNRTPVQEVDIAFEEGVATYLIEVVNLTPEQAVQVRTGDSLHDAVRNIPIGEVIDVEIRPYMISVMERETKSIRWEPVEDRVDLILTLETEVEVTEQDILIDGQFSIKGGRGLSFAGPGYAFAGAVILSLERGAVEE